jgi:hypothetical protein
MKNIPDSVPQLSANMAKDLIVSCMQVAAIKRPELDPDLWLTRAVILGRRGYYRDTMGEKGKNDRAIYDDAIALFSPSAYVTFNANTDPSQFRAGIASLEEGVWLYRLGLHGVNKAEKKRAAGGNAHLPLERFGAYEALVQAAPVSVTRDDSLCGHTEERDGQIRTRY